MGFDIETGISAATVFLQGLFSFFSPCVLPLVPLYLGYLSSGLNMEIKSGRGMHRGERLKLFIRVACFSVGISAAFFVLGVGASAAGTFFNEQRGLIARIGGGIIFLFGLYQLGIFGNFGFLGGEHRLPISIEKMTMSPITALIMGFTFSFAWTPCVGPTLTSVLLMAGSAGNEEKGFLLIGVYTLGFILPFLMAGIFTAGILSWLKRHMNIVKYTVKAGGILMMLIGVMMFTGTMNNITGYLSTADNAASSEHQHSEAGEDESFSDESSNDTVEEQNSEDSDSMRAYEFQLTDQYGKVHTLKEYEGKVIFLNFWATWCGPCRNEMPDIQKLYEEYGAQGETAEVAILGVAAPGMGQEGSRTDIIRFMEENGYTYPVLMDETGEMFSFYGISAFPTTFMIDRGGNLFGYVSGQLTEDIMRNIIEQTLEGKRS